MKRSWILIVAILLCGFRLAGQSLHDYGGQLLSFESSVSPLQTLRSSTLSVSDSHFKHGAHSACWQWSEDGAQIVINRAIPYLRENPNPKETSVSTFVFWLYSPQEINGVVRFEFLKQGRVASWFDYKLSFTGWRGAWVAFDRDMQGLPEEGMDALRITILGSERGELYLDHLILSSFQDVRHHTADLHAPFINKGTTSHWLVLLESWQHKLDNLNSDAELMRGADSHISLILERLERLFLEGAKAFPIEELRERYNHYGIEFNEDSSPKGLPIWFVRYAETYINLGYPDEKSIMLDRRQTLRQYNTLLYDIAATYCLTREESLRSELSKMYIELTRHLLDQGFEAGSALGTLHHLGYSMRDFYTAPVLMRRELQRAGLLVRVQQAMEWFSGVGEVKLAPKKEGMDIDAFNTSMIGRLASILLLSDEDLNYKYSYMQAFTRWVENGFKITSGTGPCFKSDGTVCHHRKHYPAYALDGFRGGAVNIVWLLHDTSFDVTSQAREVLRNALFEMRFYSNKRHFPLALSGRHPDGRGAIIPWLYGRMALLESENGEINIDREMAAAYMRLSSKRDTLYRYLLERGIEAERSPEGTHIYAYNASMSHRRDDWLITVAGHNRYIWASEIYNNCNHYGRYLAHGSVQLQDRATPLKSGFRQEGWDWCHIPGTTALEIPIVEMKANVLNVDRYSGYEEMLLSDESYAGGVSHRAMNGLYAMKLHEHDKYNGSLRARKSVFTFDNRVLCLGSDIENQKEGGLHTTLFQTFVEEPSKVRVVVNGEALTFPSEGDFYAPLHIIDPNGNSYFVPEGRVHIRLAHQHSLHEETDAPTEGDFCTAWIDHGGIVKGAAYEYQLTVGGGMESRVQKLSSTTTHHAAYDPLTGITAVAAFEAGECPDVSIVKSLSHPSLYMISGDSERVVLSVADPDLHLYEGESDEWYDESGKRIERSVYSRAWRDNPSKESTLKVELRGEWRLSEPSHDCEVESCRDGLTILRFRCHEAATVEVELEKLR